MICITNNEGPKAYAEHVKKLNQKFKKLVDITGRLFLAVYKERGWRYPFVNLELEFIELTKEAPSLEEEGRELKLKLAIKHIMVKKLMAERAKIVEDSKADPRYGQFNCSYDKWNPSDIVDGFDRALKIIGIYDV